MARYASSSTPLGNAEDKVIGVLNAAHEDNVVGMLKTDQTGTLHIEQSIDGGLNWDLDTSTPIVANTTLTFSQVIFAPLIRIRVVNGVTPQTFLRIAAKFSSAGDS